MAFHIYISSNECTDCTEKELKNSVKLLEIIVSMRKLILPRMDFILKFLR
jgi:hypothetical protein